MAGLIEAVYVLCALTACCCCFLLLRGYRRTGNRLLLWSGVCFLMLSIENIVLFFDLVVVPETDLFLFRGGAGLVGICCLVYGLVWESRKE